MAAELNIFEPQVSVVSRDMAGKSIMVYGSNRLGKTKVACSLPKPCYLAFEDGLNAIAGVPFFPMTDWKSYVQFVKQITNPANLSKAKEMYQTIIIDQAEAMGNLCASYICSKFGVQSLGESKFIPGTTKKDYTFNGYKELDTENQKWLRPLLLAGFTVFFIDHEGTREFKDESGEEYTKIMPRGDRRIIDAICDAVDIIGYVVANGLDENGVEIKSSLVLANSKKALAGSRFDYLVPYLKEFSADALVKAVADAVAEQEKAEGHSAVSFEEQKKTRTVAKNRPYKEVVADIQQYAQKHWSEELNDMDEAYKNIVQEYLGKNGSVKASTPDQIEQLEMILFDLKQLEA